MEPTPRTENLQRLAATISRFKKQKHMLEMSEKDFRDRVVRPIFLQQGFRDGRDTCGTTELGKDCYFTQTSELTGTDVIVVQTKIGRITMAGTKPKENLDKIVTQLRTALNTQVVLVTDKKKKYPIEAVLVSSGEINEHARRHISDDLRDARLKFVDVETLIPLIDSHMPELWLGIDSDVISYFRETCRAIEQGSERIAAGIAVDSDNTYTSVLDDAYASVHVVRTRPRPVVKGRKLKPKSKRTVFDSSFPVTSLVNEHDRLLLVLGEGGSGKTNALTRITYDLCRRKMESPTTVIVPFLLRARDLATDPSCSLLDHAVAHVRSLRPDLKQPFSADDLHEGRVLFMVDGLDEVGDAARTDQIVNSMLRFAADYPRCQVIATSRGTEYIKNSEIIKAFTPYNIATLNLSQAEKIIKALSRRKSLSNEESAEILRQLRDIHGVTLSPLIVTIFAATSDITRRDVPPNITELFKKYTELMLGRWDEGKKLHQQTQAPIKDLVLQQIAFRLHDRRLTSLSIAEFRSMVQEELRTRGFIEETELLYDEIVERSGLFRVYSERIEFRHLLFQEFFAGRAIKDPKYIDKIIEDYWWKRAIVFYFGENPNDIESLRGLALSLKEKVGDTAFVAATTVGLSLQACYFAHVDSKADVYSMVTSSIMTAMGNDGLFANELDEFPYIRLLVCFLLARESLALANLKLFIDDVEKKLWEACQGDPEREEEVRFWLAVGLLQSGLYELAAERTAHFKLKSPSLLLALWMELLTCSSVRISSKNDRDQLRALEKLVLERLKPHLVTLSREFARELRTARETGKLMMPEPRESGEARRIDSAPATDAEVEK